LCNQIEILQKESYFEKSFLINAFLISQNKSFSLWSLVNSDSAVYILIHMRLVNKVCRELELQFISLFKEKLIHDYDEKLFKKTITHKILSNLIINSHKKSIVFMLIVDLEHHEAILSKLWMNKNEILLNMHHDIIIFSDQLDSSIFILSISLNAKHSSWLRLTSISSAFKILKCLTSTVQKEAFSIQNINVVSF
jgi:hypothetical protein